MRVGPAGLSQRKVTGEYALVEPKKQPRAGTLLGPACACCAGVHAASACCDRQLESRRCCQRPGKRPWRGWQLATPAWVDGERPLPCLRVQAPARFLTRAAQTRQRAIERERERELLNARVSAAQAQGNRGRGEFSGPPRTHGREGANRDAVARPPRGLCDAAGPPTLPGRSSLPCPDSMRRAQGAHVGPWQTVALKLFELVHKLAVWCRSWVNGSAGDEQ